MERLRPPAWPPTNPYSGVVSDFAHCEADFRDLQVTLIITTKLLLIQSDLVSLSLTIALPKALGSASARGEFSPSTRAPPPLVSIANHAGVGSLQGEA